MPSQADLEMCKKFKSALGSIAKMELSLIHQRGYSVFGGDENKTDFIKTPEGPTKKLTVHKFDTQVFSENIEKKQIRSSEDVASIVSAQRLNSGNNLLSFDLKQTKCSYS